MRLIKRDAAIIISVIFFLLFTIWWITLRSMNFPNDSNENQLFAAVYGIIALWGGIWGITISHKWGGFRSVLGKSILLFSIGLFFQEIGQLSYSYYIYFLRIPLPYPSIGDLFFYSTIPLYIAATLLLAQASGAHISLKQLSSKLQAVIVPVAVLILSYVIFLEEYKFDWTNPLKVFIDFAAPFGQAIYISLALLTFILTRNILGGIMKNRVMLILFALLAQFTADWTFLYQASRGTWYAGGLNDYMYLVAYFLMTIALLQLNTVYKKLKHVESDK
jgi:hypothetical protein